MREWHYQEINRLIIYSVTNFNYLTVVMLGDWHRKLLFDRRHAVIYWKIYPSNYCIDEMEGNVMRINFSIQPRYNTYQQNTNTDTKEYARIPHTFIHTTVDTIQAWNTNIYTQVCIYIDICINHKVHMFSLSPRLCLICMYKIYIIYGICVCACGYRWKPIS